MLGCVAGLLAETAMSSKHGIDVLQDPLSLLALKYSLFLAIVDARLGVLLSIFVGHAIVRVRTRTSGILESLSFLSFSFPGIGIGFMWFFVQTPLVVAANFVGSRFRITAE